MFADGRCKRKKHGCERTSKAGTDDSYRPAGFSPPGCPNCLCPEGENCIMKAGTTYSEHLNLSIHGNEIAH